jgi:hypothetical protein
MISIHTIPIGHLLLLFIVRTLFHGVDMTHSYVIQNVNNWQEIFPIRTTAHMFKIAGPYWCTYYNTKKWHWIYWGNWSCSMCWRWILYVLLGVKFIDKKNHYQRKLSSTWHKEKNPYIDDIILEHQC